MLKIIFIVESKFNKRDFKRFGFKILKERGYEVHVWDFTYLLRINTYKKYTPPDPINYSLHRKIKSKDEFYELLGDIGDNYVFVCMIGQNPGSKFIFDQLEVYKYHFGITYMGAIPYARNSTYKRIICSLTKPARIIKIIKSRFRLFRNKISPNFIITGGHVAYKTAKSTYPNSRIISTHSFDYDLFLETETNSVEHKSFDDRKYADFLDEFVPYHPDYLNMGIEPDATPKIYFPEINKFFEKFEIYHDIRIVIAAHPRSNYSINNQNPFNNREIVFGKTNELVKNSEFVITHASTAISFAILYRKYLIFLKSSNYNNRFNNYIDSVAQYFNQSAFDISLDGELNLNIGVSERIYSNYVNQYIKDKNTPQKPAWELFADYCDSLC